MISNENIDVDKLLKDALGSTETPDPALIERVKNEYFREDTILKKNTVSRSFGTVAAAAIMFVILTTSVFAAWYFLKPSEVADKFSDSALSVAFNSESAVNINKSITSGDYIFTLLATVSGEDITDHPSYSNGELLTGRTYAIVAIQKSNGDPMPSTADAEYGRPSFYVSPYVKGLKPWQVNAHTMNGGHSDTVVGGIMYRILNCDEVSIFSDRGVYIGINTGSFYDSQAFFFNEQTGELKINPDYSGSNAVFELPLDKSLADPIRAQQYIDNMWNDDTTSDVDVDAEFEIFGNTEDVTGISKVMTYDEYKKWAEQKLEDTQILVDSGKYPKEAMELDRQGYKSNLKEIGNGATLILTEYTDGSYAISITAPNAESDVKLLPANSILVTDESKR